jgi:hypothetical protein
MRLTCYDRLLTSLNKHSNRNTQSCEHRWVMMMSGENCLKRQIKDNLMPQIEFLLVAKSVHFNSKRNLCS